MKRKATILLADDDKVQTAMLSARLRTAGYSVATAYDATYTFMVAMKSPPDAVVLDIMMPGGTGRAVLERLKGSSKTRRIPVIVLSGLTDKHTIQDLLGLGACEYLTKPVDVERLLDALQRALGADEPAPSTNVPPATAPPSPPFTAS